MSGSTMFAVAWLSMATSVYAWGAVMIVACRTLNIRPRRAFFVDGGFESWALLAIFTVILLPAAVGLLVCESVLIHREVRR